MSVQFGWVYSLWKLGGLLMKITKLSQGYDLDSYIITLENDLGVPSAFY